MMQDEYSEKILTISIPTWNRCELLRELLDQLTKQINGSDLEYRIEILISDNGSTDDTEIMVKSYQKSCNFISYNNNNINIGARANVLKSMQLASGKFLMVLGDDDRINENTLIKLVDFLQNNDEIGLIIDCFKFKKNSVGNNSIIELTSLLENFYWHMGNAGVFIAKTSYIKSNLRNHTYEFFNLCWPQTQLLILGLYQNKNLKCCIKAFDITSDAVHEQVMVYTSYYLWRTCYYDLYTAVESIRSQVDDQTVDAAKKYLRDNIGQLFFNILQCGIFLDDKETRQKTVEHISKNINKFSWKEKIYFRIICISLSMPSILAKLISDIFIFSIRGVKGVRKKNDFIRSEKIKKAKMLNSDNLIIREFQF